MLYPGSVRVVACMEMYAPSASVAEDMTANLAPDVIVFLLPSEEVHIHRQYIGAGQGLTAAGGGGDGSTSNIVRRISVQYKF